MSFVLQKMVACEDRENRKRKAGMPEADDTALPDRPPLSASQSPNLPGTAPAKLVRQNPNPLAVKASPTLGTSVGPSVQPPVINPLAVPPDPLPSPIPQSSTLPPRPPQSPVFRPKDVHVQELPEGISGRGFAIKFTQPQDDKDPVAVPAKLFVLGEDRRIRVIPCYVKMARLGSEAELLRHEANISFWLQRQPISQHALLRTWSVLESDRRLYIVMPKAVMDLLNFLEIMHGNAPSLSAKEKADLAIFLCLQMAGGLLAANQGRVAHGDIKPANFAIPGNGLGIKLFDFGTSFLWGEAPPTTDLSTDSHLAPELGDEWTPEGSPGTIQNEVNTADIYSLGRSFLEVIFGNLPDAALVADSPLLAHVAMAAGFRPECTPVQHILSGRDDEEFCENMLTFGSPDQSDGYYRLLATFISENWPKELPEALRSLILNMIHPDPDERPNIAQVVLALKPFEASLNRTTLLPSWQKVLNARSAPAPIPTPPDAPGSAVAQSVAAH